MSDPNEEQATLLKQAIQPEKTGEAEQKQNDAGSRENDEEKKLERNQSDVRSSINRSRSDDSLKNDVNLADSIMGEDVMKQEEAEIIKQIPEDYFYSEDEVKEFQTISDSPINENVAKLDYLYGHDSFKNYNALILDRDTIVYSSGISYTIYNHFTKDKQVFYSKDRGGIGAIAVHPSKKYFAVAEKGTWPKVFIYQYPSLKLYRVIRKGTEKSFSCINFSGDGDMLATVGSAPDYLLTVWEWKQQRMMLKSKAFSQDVYRVNFSQFNEKWITTSGTGHIRFWRISSTFTGMKLKGDIAKFGQFQISDVASFAQFQDANVVSSSEYGKLLLWEGNLIKSVIGINQETPCHKGSIEFVKMVGNQIVSAGSDGYIRFWDAQQLNTGESDEHFNFYIKPSKQIYFQAINGGPAHLLWIDMEQDFWIVQDANGRTWKYQLADDKRTQIIRYNSGKFTDFAFSPLNNCLISTGYDGVVRLWDYGSQKQFYNIAFKAKSQATCIEWIPFSKKNHGRMVAVGFSDGIIRFLFINATSFQLIKAIKIHKNAVTKIKSNREGTIVVVSDTSGSLFFVSMDSPIISKITPYCLFETGFKINDMSWDRNGEKILVGCQDGRLHEINAVKEKDCDYSQTYVRDFQCRSLTIKMMDSQKPNREELQLELMLKKTKGIQVDESVLDVEWQPAPIMNCIYYDTECTKILCSVDGKYLGYYYVVDFNKERPISGIEASKVRTSYIGFMESQDLLFIGLKNGTWEVRHKFNPSLHLKKLSFDQDYGVVRKIGMNLQNSAILSASEDGTLLCHKFDYESFKKGTKGDSIDDIQISIPSVILGISQATFGDKIQLGKDVGQDIEDSSIYCLKDQKLKAGEDMKMTEAEKVKYKKLKKIKQLRELFNSIVESNKRETDHLAKLTPEEMLVDPEYAEMIHKRVIDEEEETRKVLAWDEYYAELARKKLQEYFIDELEFKKFSVKGIQKNRIVSSFKLKKLSPYVQTELQKIDRIIKEEEEIMSKKNDRKNKTSSSFAQSKALLDINKQKQVRKVSKEENQDVRNKIREAEAEFEKQLTHAIAMKGDYKLKCAPDYVVPESQRLNVSRKKKHLFLHYQYVFMEKRQFNERLSQLRNKKRQLVEKLSGINSKLHEINVKLGDKDEDIIVEINEEYEGMEAEIQILPQDIEEHIIQKQKEKEASKKGGGMGMGGGDTGEKKQEKEEKKQKRIIRPEKVIIKETGPNLKLRNTMKPRRTSLKSEVETIERIILASERQKIKNDIENEIKAFDKELEDLYLIKQNMESDLTLVEMKILTYAQEFIIFRDMQTYDNELMQQLNHFGVEKQKFEETFMNLSNQIQEIESILQDHRKKYEDEKKVLKEFVYPEDDQMREKILRFYKIRQRKRKNKQKRQAQQEQKKKEEEENSDSEEEEESQSEQESEDDSEDEFEEDDEKPDITVIQNDHKNFERVRKICEYDEKIEENSRKKSELEKERNQTNKKIQNLDMELNRTEQKLKEYQKKKLLKINQLVVSYPVHLSQVQYTTNVDGKLRVSDDFSQAILFTHAAFDKLSHRIEELKNEKVEIEKKKTILNKKLTKLNDSMAKASSEIETKRKQYEEKQLLKFGSTFEMERLKELQPNKQVLETRDLYKKEERQISRKIEDIKTELQAKKRDLLEAKKQNTKVISQITELGERENQLKKKLDSTNKQLFKNYDASKKDELDKQRQNLKDLIKFLSKEIQDLKTEIGLFKRKGGHIYTMVTSNKKNFS